MRRLLMPFLCVFVLSSLSLGAENYPGGRDVRVNGDVDIYDVPGGEGKVIGILEEDRIVAIFECRDDNWCSISGGWVWGDFFDR